MEPATSVMLKTLEQAISEVEGLSYFLRNYYHTNYKTLEPSELSRLEAVLKLVDMPDGQPQTESDGLKQLYCMICQKPMQIVSEMHEHTGISKLYMECATCSDHLASSIELLDTVRQEYITSGYVVTDQDETFRMVPVVCTDNRDEGTTWLWISDIEYIEVNIKELVENAFVNCIEGEFQFKDECWECGTGVDTDPERGNLPDYVEIVLNGNPMQPLHRSCMKCAAKFPGVNNDNLQAYGAPRSIAE